MSQQHNMSGKIREFLSQSLEKDKIAFLYLGYAGIVLRLEDKVAAFDIADLLGNSAGVFKLFLSVFLVLSILL